MWKLRILKAWSMSLLISIVIAVASLVAAPFSEVVSSLLLSGGLALFGACVIIMVAAAIIWLAMPDGA